MTESILTFQPPTGRGTDSVSNYMGFTVISCHLSRCQKCQVTSPPILPGEKWRVALELKDNPAKGTQFYIAHRSQRILEQFDWEMRAGGGLLAVGGYGEIGGNCTAYIDDKEAFVVDVGLMIRQQGNQAPGIGVLDDCQIGTILDSHGHLDHIGANHVLAERHPEAVVRGTPTTLEYHGLLERNRLEEDETARPLINPTERISDADFGEETRVTERISYIPFPVDHSIPESIGLVVKVGDRIFVHPSDFRFSASSWERRQEFRSWLDWIAREFPNATLVLDCLGATRANGSVTEEQVWRELEDVILEAPGRVFVTTYGSQIERNGAILAIIESWQSQGVLGFGGLRGRAMTQGAEIAEKLGFWQVPEISRGGKKVFLIAGSQAESDSAMVRSLEGFERSDTIVISAAAIPENVEAIRILCEGLLEIGCRVVIDTNQPAEIPATERRTIHTSGHESLPGLLEVIHRLKPMRVIPIHGGEEHTSALKNALVAKGYPEEFVMAVKSGDFVAA